MMLRLNLAPRMKPCTKTHISYSIRPSNMSCPELPSLLSDRCLPLLSLIHPTKRRNFAALSILKKQSIEQISFYLSFFFINLKIIFRCDPIVSNVNNSCIVSNEHAIHTTLKQNEKKRKVNKITKVIKRSTSAIRDVAELAVNKESKIRLAT